jgi:transposase
MQKANSGIIKAMQNAACARPNDPADLRAQVLELQERVAQQEQLLEERARHIEQLLDAITLLKRKHFGRSADVLSPDQLSLFDEAELEALIGELHAEVEALSDPSASTEERPPPPPKDQPVRRPLPKHLPRVERIIDLSAQAKAALGPDWVLIGYDDSEQLAVIPRQPYVIVIKRAKYAPRNDAAVAPDAAGVIIAPRAAQILPKSIAHSSLLADVVAGKFLDALPLYRQEKIFARDGIEVSRRTMSSWMIQLNETLTPVMAAIKAVLDEGAVIQIDETRVQVLDEPGRSATHNSFMWVYCGGPADRPVIWFQYAETRSGEVPKQFLFPDPPEGQTHDPPPRWYLVSDGYSAYPGLARQDGILGHGACWAHVRRKFVEAAEARRHTGAAHQMVAMIGQLYAIERQCREASPEQRQAIRAEHSQPILDKTKAWLDEKVAKVLPKGLLGTAIAYALGQWPQLTTFLEDGRIPIDNNIAENAIRPFVIGRKNWLFAGSPSGAEASATLYSLIETAKANGLEPKTYLNHLFEHLPLATTPDAIAALLPMNLSPEDLAPIPTHLPASSQAL